MSVNLGTPAMQALLELRANPNWKIVLAGLEDAVVRAMHGALQADTADMARQIGVARGLNDVYVALATATEGVKAQNFARVSPVGRGRKAGSLEDDLIGNGAIT